MEHPLKFTADKELPEGCNILERAILLKKWQSSRGAFIDKCCEGERRIRHIYECLNGQPPADKAVSGTLIHAILCEEKLPKTLTEKQYSVLKSQVGKFQEFWTIRGELAHSTAQAVSLDGHVFALILSNARKTKNGPLTGVFLLDLSDLNETYKALSNTVNRLKQFAEKLSP